MVRIEKADDCFDQSDSALVIFGYALLVSLSVCTSWRCSYFLFARSPTREKSGQYAATTIKPITIPAMIKVMVQQFWIIGQLIPERGGLRDERNCQVVWQGGLSVRP